MAKIIQFPIAQRLAQVAADRSPLTSAQVSQAVSAAQAAAGLSDAEVAELMGAMLTARPPADENPITTTTGAAYTPGMDIKDIAKLVRKDIKAAIKAGTLPKGLKCSVKIDRYSMGQSLDIVVTACPVQVANPTWYAEAAAGNTRALEGLDRIARVLPAGKAIEAKLEAIGGSYRQSARDRHTDYCTTNFFLSVSICGALLNSQGTL